MWFNVVQRGCIFELFQHWLYSSEHDVIIRYQSWHGRKNKNRKKNSKWSIEEDNRNDSGMEKWKSRNHLFASISFENKNVEKHFPGVLVRFVVERKTYYASRLTRSSTVCRIKKLAEIRTCLVRNDQNFIAILKSVAQHNCGKTCSSFVNFRWRFWGFGPRNYLYQRRFTTLEPVRATKRELELSLYVPI